jgi:hypothetical protein
VAATWRLPTSTSTGSSEAEEKIISAGIRFRGIVRGPFSPRGHSCRRLFDEFSPPAPGPRDHEVGGWCSGTFIVANPLSTARIEGATGSAGEGRTERAVENHYFQRHPYGPLLWRSRFAATAAPYRFLCTDGTQACSMVVCEYSRLTGASKTTTVNDLHSQVGWTSSPCGRLSIWLDNPELGAENWLLLPLPLHCVAHQPQSRSKCTQQSAPMSTRRNHGCTSSPEVHSDAYPRQLLRLSMSSSRLWRRILLRRSARLCIFSTDRETLSTLAALPARPAQRERRPSFAAEPRSFQEIHVACGWLRNPSGLAILVPIQWSVSVPPVTVVSRAPLVPRFWVLVTAPTPKDVLMLVA